MYDCDVNFSGCIEPPKDIGKYKKFMIRISGLYFSGDDLELSKILMFGKQLNLNLKI